MDEPADPLDKARAEVTVMARLLDILEPFGTEERGRILAAAAARLGHYDLAIEALRAAAAAARGRV